MGQLSGQWYFKVLWSLFGMRYYLDRDYRVQLCQKLEMVAVRNEIGILSKIQLFYRKTSRSGIEVAFFFSQL